MRFAVPLTLDARALVAWDRDAVVVELVGATMGTGWRVRAACPPARPIAPLRAAIERRLDGLVGEMSHWLPGSLLCRFNAAPAGRWMALPPDFATVIAAALAVAARSDGAFDPAIGVLVDLWGFGPPGPCPPPDDAAVAAALARSGWRRLAWEAGARRLRQPGGTALDLSGIAKGFAVDAISDLLTGAGVTHHLVEIGGECRGRGLRPDGDPWWVALETPPGVAVAPIRVALHEGAVATSGDYVRGSHTIDPRSGRPATAAVAVSVLHASAMWADAWASALTVLDPADATALAVREGLGVRLLHRAAGGAAEWISPALAAMLAD